MTQHLQQYGAQDIILLIFFKFFYSTKNFEVTPEIWKMISAKLTEMF
jgi:hypothetical protein